MGQKNDPAGSLVPQSQKIEGPAEISGDSGTGWPHFRQNFEPAGSSVWHFVQDGGGATGGGSGLLSGTFTAWPHFKQKCALSGRVVRQLLHSTAASQAC